MGLIWWGVDLCMCVLFFVMIIFCFVIRCSVLLKCILCCIMCNGSVMVLCCVCCGVRWVRLDCLIVNCLICMGWVVIMGMLFV